MCDILREPIQRPKYIYAINFRKCLLRAPASSWVYIKSSIYEGPKQRSRSIPPRWSLNLVPSFQSWPFFKQSHARCRSNNHKVEPESNVITAHLEEDKRNMDSISVRRAPAIFLNCIFMELGQTLCFMMHFLQIRSHREIRGIANIFSLAPLAYLLLQSYAHNLFMPPGRRCWLLAYYKPRA